MKLKNLFKTLKYALPFAALSLLPHEAKGQQQIVWPTGVINPFLSSDTTEAAKAYNTIRGLSSGDITARNNLWDARVQTDRTHTLQGGPGIDWNCQHWTLLQIVNAHDWGSGVWGGFHDALLYNGYSGWDEAQIYANSGTLIDEGKLGVPLYTISFIIDPITREAHTQTSLLTGNNALDGKAWNDTEPRDGITQVKPGQLNMPLNTEEFDVIHYYLYENSSHKKNLGGIKILGFKIVNGEKILTYNINDDPIFGQFIHLITERENDPPKINVRPTSSLDSLVVDIVEANPKSRKLRIDDGAPIDIAQNEKRKLNLSVGTHKIEIYADDYFNLSSDTIFTRTILEPKPGNASITSPLNGATEVPQPVYIASSIAANAKKYQFRIFDASNQLILDTTLVNNSFSYNKFDGNRKYTLMVRALNSQTGEWSTISQFVTFNNAPVVQTIRPANSDQVDPTRQIEFEYTASDKDKDQLTSALHIWNATKDIKIPSITESTYKLKENELEKYKTYSYEIITSDGTKTTKSDLKTFNTGTEPIVPESKVYPNPVEEILKIKYKSGLSVNAFVSIYSLDGETILRKNIDGAREEYLDVTRYKSGMYIISIVDGKDKDSYKIIIK